MGTKGIYEHQSTRDTDFSIGVSHNGKRYTAYAGYIFNTIRMQENGGVIDDWYVTGQDVEQPFDIPFMLSDAQNIMKNNTFYTWHSYGIPLRRLTDDDFRWLECLQFMWDIRSSMISGQDFIRIRMTVCIP